MTMPQKRSIELFKGVERVHRQGFTSAASPNKYEKHDETQTRTSRSPIRFPEEMACFHLFVSFLPSQSVRNIWMQHGKEIIPPNIDIVGPAGDRVGAAQAWRMRRISRMRIWNAKMPSNQELNHHQKRCHFSRQIRTVSSVFLVSKLTGLGHWPGDD